MLQDLDASVAKKVQADVDQNESDSMLMQHYKQTSIS
jgi:hypothetical protein